MCIRDRIVRARVNIHRVNVIVTGPLCSVLLGQGGGRAARERSGGTARRGSRGTSRRGSGRAIVPYAHVHVTTGAIVISSTLL